ncbi:uncharacterized protein LOC114711796 [Neltuma alba]|uniref:uncharacterized protein LOC114711796 n=1 Tax=Neltuma alba TaxID=207710 RepID=UPI0010A2BD1D|nr:uncharacterized protein LOC114711796 [Prosopis alba]
MSSPQCSRIAQLTRLVPCQEGFDKVIRVLTDIVEKHYPDALVMEQSPKRMWALIACNCIYQFTGDVISGSLALAILISFMVRPDLVPYVFIIWATFVLVCVRFHI